jgi:hypothetical protein
MLHYGFIAATWLIGVFGVGGAAAAVAACVFLGPTAAIAIVGPVFQKFLACIWCVVAVVFFLSTTGSYWIGREGEYSRGHMAAIAGVAAGDAKTIAAAKAKRSVWQECRTRSGQWDQATGECK